MIDPRHTLTASLFFLLSAATISGMLYLLQRLGKMQTKEELKKQGFAYFPLIIRSFAKEREWETLWFSLHFGKIIFYLMFACSFFFFILQKMYAEKVANLSPTLITIQVLISVILALSIDFLMQLMCAKKPKLWFKALALPSSVLLTITLPLSFIFLKLSSKLFPQKTEFKPSTSFRVHDKILEWIRDSEVESLLEKSERKLLYAVISFKDRIAREVMVPRIRVFSLPSDTTIFEAAKNFLQEGYSRIPIYKENIDTIIGVLLYKDVLNLLINDKNRIESMHSKTIESLIKPVVYTPETKKISVLLQELRSKKNHLALVVDEYGGTEGIVTIEDILEELVGEIEDEYDVQQTDLISSLTGGGWIIDAKMGIIDIEEEIGIQIPTAPEYDTIGGFVFHKAGSIPSKGWRVHLDEFDLEVISSDERSINKIKITPHKNKK